ncbi:hypothetical protein PtA15_7A330 [Puccinia triticina]|uniref:Uncharacterized protein n=1 Tax=Puccinia triticina TaxID=208348 RepID=A0ABY7CPM1_9BASI|nr:uncharacterized protein PtA15_7A330 [Puccinia triticina]WAQ86604.1 hypothetical protein PtA15_7A330 [Puccinia triticina]
MYNIWLADMYLAFGLTNDSPPPLPSLPNCTGGAYFHRDSFQELSGAVEVVRGPEALKAEQATAQSESATLSSCSNNLTGNIAASPLCS